MKQLKEVARACGFMRSFQNQLNRTFKHCNPSTLLCFFNVLLNVRYYRGKYALIEMMSML